MQAYRIKLLGKLEVEGNETTITRFRTRKTALLLAYLAYYQDNPASRDVLIETLWPELDCDAARNSLSTALSSLRRQLEPPGVTPGTILIADRYSVQIRPGAVDTDVAEFIRALRDANTVTGLEKGGLLEAALHCYGGPLLPDYDADWLRRERLILEKAHLQARREWEESQTLRANPAERAVEKLALSSPPLVLQRRVRRRPIEQAGLPSFDTVGTLGAFVAFLCALQPH